MTCTIDLALTTRDRSTDRHKQMRVSCAENHLSRTFDVNRRIEDEFAKNASSR